MPAFICLSSATIARALARPPAPDVKSCARSETTDPGVAKAKVRCKPTPQNQDTNGSPRELSTRPVPEPEMASSWGQKSNANQREHNNQARRGFNCGRRRTFELQDRLRRSSASMLQLGIASGTPLSKSHTEKHKLHPRLTTNYCQVAYFERALAPAAFLHMSRPTPSRCGSASCHRTKTCGPTRRCPSRRAGEVAGPQ